MYGLQRSGINSSDVEILSLTNVTEEDAGEYICKVSNYIGEASQSGWLTVIPGNHWDLTPRAPPSPGEVSQAAFLTCCAVGVLLVVSWLSWGSWVFSSLMSDLCVIARAMEALGRPADQTHKLSQLAPPGWCIRLVFGNAVLCSPCSVYKCMCTNAVFYRLLVMGTFLLYLFFGELVSFLIFLWALSLSLSWTVYTHRTYHYLPYRQDLIMDAI